LISKNASGARLRDDGFPNCSERKPNFSERNPSRDGTNSKSGGTKSKFKSLAFPHRINDLSHSQVIGENSRATEATVMAGLVSAIHAVMLQSLPTLSIGQRKILTKQSLFFLKLRLCGAPSRVDGRDKPGHDKLSANLPGLRSQRQFSSPFAVSA
jgi:hypothetical protein